MLKRCFRSEVRYVPAKRRYDALQTVTFRDGVQAGFIAYCVEIVRSLPISRIAEVSALGMGDPEVVPLWYGEGDLPTPDFIARGRERRGSRRSHLLHL